MSIVSRQSEGLRRRSGQGVAQSRTAVPSRASVSCKSASGSQEGTGSTDSLSVPEWVPTQANPAFEFLNSTTFDVKQWGVYQKYAAKYVEDPAFQQLVGWKAIPEMINGRLCMLGFTGALFAEVLGGKPLLTQLAAGSQAVFLTSLLVVIGSCVPAVKGVKGDYVEALKDTYTLPKGVFTESMERVHGRLAMVAMASMILFETISGRALL
eukprot:jgi/Ulvmu1/8757/UM048_0011.1